MTRLVAGSTNKERRTAAFKQLLEDCYSRADAAKLDVHIETLSDYKDTLVDMGMVNPKIIQYAFTQRKENINELPVALVWALEELFLSPGVPSCSCLYSRMVLIMQRSSPIEHGALHPVPCWHTPISGQQQHFSVCFSSLSSLCRRDICLVTLHLYIVGAEHTCLALAVALLD